MKQLRDKNQLTDDMYDEFEDKPQGGTKKLPDAFDGTEDEMSFLKSVILSIILHPSVVILAWLVVFLLTLWGLLPDEFKKPALKQRDIEFVLTEREAKPINKNTPYRSDKDSRAGGEHDPTRKVSQPSPTPAPAKAPSPAPAQKQPQKQQPKPKPQPQPQKVAPKPTPVAPKQPVQQKPAPPKPTPAPKPSVAPPTAKPAATNPKPALPKISSNPKSPFSVGVPKSTQPVGPAPSYGTGATSSGAAPKGTSSAGSGALAPQFSASKNTSGGSGSRGSSGSYGSGNLGNPSPGNRAGAPGIDALAQPNWGAYMAEVERRVKRNWSPPKGEESKRVVVLFKIGKDGRLLSIRVTKSSGQPLADQAAKAAIELSAPFRPLPPEYKDNSIDIDFTFDYNVVGAKRY